ncbi:MAG: hypothetical protein ACJ8KU_03595 [Chthoniobacterales bacterium]
MKPTTARMLGIVLGFLALALALLATVVRYSWGKPTDYTALIGAVLLLFFMIVIVRPGAKK